MTIGRSLAVCVACLPVLVPPRVLALELGPIEARSALHEPLDARIPIRDAKSGDFEGLDVELGSPAQFELARVARLQHLELLEFIVVEQSDGDGYIHVRTDEPISEPSLTFLIDVDWPRGRTVRGYRLRLPSVAASAAGADRTSADRSRRTTPETRPAPETQPEPETGPSEANLVSPPASGRIDYGPVRESETLWSIAARLRPDRSVSVQRMMLAIVEANPEAFVIGNVNGLNAGTTLRIPGRDEIGPDNLNAAIAEVQRQHSAWAEYRKGARTAPTPTPPTPPPPAPSPPDSETEPSGRIEVVSPETTTGVTEQGEGANVDALRNELALATEEADASRRENDELKLRLVEAEDHIAELLRLVDLKNEEIAALQSELRTLSEPAPEPVPIPAEEEPTPVAVSAEEEPEPTVASAEAESTQVPASGEDQPKSIMAPAEAEPKSLPFGLGTLPVNPVFLVGGAGILLLLLGVWALLRRRRTSAEEDGALDVADENEALDVTGGDEALEGPEASPPDEDDLLGELEAVAAELADERDGPRDRRSRAGLVALPDLDLELESPKNDAARSELDDLAVERTAESWQDDRATKRPLLAKAEADDDATGMTFDIDELTRDDPDFDAPDSRNRRDETSSDEFDVDDLADLAGFVEEQEADLDRTDDEAADGLDLLFSREEAEAADPGTDDSNISPVSDGFDIDEIADLAAETEVDPDRTADEAISGLDLLFTRSEPEADDSDIHQDAPATDAGDPLGRDSDILADRQDDGRSEPLVANLDDQTAESGSAGTTEEGDDWRSDKAAERSVDFEPSPGDDSDRSISTSQVLLGESPDSDETDAFTLEEFGADEVQTKIDLAQVYMEMGDIESARGLLEAVLATGNAEQQDSAREMLSKLD